MLPIHSKGSVPIGYHEKHCHIKTSLGTVVNHEAYPVGAMALSSLVYPPTAKLA